MTKYMLDIFIRNQLFINPRYAGELLIVQGETYDTTEQTMEIRKDFKINSSDTMLEMYIAYVCNEDSIAILSNGKEITLSQMLRMFKKDLPIKRHAERVLKQVLPAVMPYLGNSLYTGKAEVIGNTLIVPTKSKEAIEQAFKHLFGLAETRFIFNASKSISNGNIMDLNQETLKRFAGLSGNYSSYANLIRAMGYPFSDYRRYVDKGILVSTDLYDNVFVIKDDYLYCMSMNQLVHVLDDDSEQKVFEVAKNEYALGNLEYDTRVLLDKSLRYEMIEEILKDE